MKPKESPDFPNKDEVFYSIDKGTVSLCIGANNKEAIKIMKKYFNEPFATYADIWNEGEIVAMDWWITRKEFTKVKKLFKSL